MKLNANAWKGFQPPSLHHGGVLSLHVRPSAKQQRFKRRRCASAGSEPFSLLICPDDAKFVLISVLALIEPICPKIYSKSRLKSAKIPLPVDVRCSKTSLLKLPINDYGGGSENVAEKKMHPYKMYHVYLDPLNLSNVGDLSWN